MNLRPLAGSMGADGEAASCRLSGHDLRRTFIDLGMPPHCRSFLTSRARLDPHVARAQTIRPMITRKTA
jgi:hypothetical protein